MARRIVHADQSGFAADAQSVLVVDRWLEVDWKPKVFIDSWSGDVASQAPSFKVGLSQPGFDGRSDLLEYGTISSPEDVAWLRDAAHGSLVTREAKLETGTDVVARVHQVGVKRDGRTGFSIELLTGEDARAVLAKARRERVIATFKELWWLIPIGIGVIWLVV